MRQLLLCDIGPGAAVVERLPQPDSVWEEGYPHVMSTPPGRPLHRYWRHYYGASAEMQFSGADLTALQQDVAVILLQSPEQLPSAVQAFLLALQQLCERAQQRQAVLQVVAD